MRKTKKSYVYLTGGLGNQLFQIAFLLTRNSEVKIVETTLGRPRRSRNNLPDVFSFDFSNTLERNELESDFPLTRKAINYLLRDGLEPIAINNIPGARKFSKLLTSLLISRVLETPVQVNVSSDNGYVYKPMSMKNEFLIGYFQSFRWLNENPEVQNFMRSLRLQNPRSELTDFLLERSYKKCVAMHVRLGDYTLDPSLGILSRQYYQEALVKMSESIEIDEIWLFSNDPRQAESYLPREYIDKVVIINDSNWDAAETLEVMRHAKAYIIGNSSLSWWGATISYTSCPLVVAPTPWFRSRKDPKDLIPRDWVQINGWH